MHSGLKPGVWWGWAGSEPGEGVVGAGGVCGGVRVLPPLDLVPAPAELRSARGPTGFLYGMLSAGSLSPCTLRSLFILSCSGWACVGPGSCQEAR